MELDLVGYAYRWRPEGSEQNSEPRRDFFLFTSDDAGYVSRPCATLSGRDIIGELNAHTFIIRTFCSEAS
jgi:hypothetical protein